MRPLPSEMLRLSGSFLEDRPIVTRAFYGRAAGRGGGGRQGHPDREDRGSDPLDLRTDDRLWPSTRLSEMAIERLEVNEHPFPYEHLRYEGRGT